MAHYWLNCYTVRKFHIVGVWIMAEWAVVSPRSTPKESSTMCSESLFQLSRPLYYLLFWGLFACVSIVYPCIYLSIYLSVLLPLHKQTLNRWISITCMYVCMYVRVHVCMFTRTHTHISSAFYNVLYLEPCPQFQRLLLARKARPRSLKS